MSVLCKVLDPSSVDLLKSSIQNTWQFYFKKKWNKKNFDLLNLEKSKWQTLEERRQRVRVQKTSCAVVHHFRRNQSFALVGFAFSEVPGERRFPKGDFRVYGRQGGSVKWGHAKNVRFAQTLLEKVLRVFRKNAYLPNLHWPGATCARKVASIGSINADIFAFSFHPPPQFFFFPWETYSAAALERTRNENSEYDWYRSIDFLLQMYLITWLQKSLNQPLFSVRQYKVKSILQIKYLKIWQKY